MSARVSPPVAWVRGIPSAALVAAHAARHGERYADDYRQRHYGGGAPWIYVGDAFPDAPGILRLRVNPDTGVVELQNGHTFFQPLAECNWAARCKYRPCDRDGTPVSLPALKRRARGAP